MRTFVRWIIIIFVVLGVASVVGVSLESLWVAVSAIIAMTLVGFFASWSLLSNTLAALVIMIWRPFEVGDRIEIMSDNIAGEVTDINLMYSKVTTQDGEVVNVPNNMFLSRFVKRRLKH
jgi:small-conductance mechanosensitive channel